ncbi:Transmembrane protein 41-like protein [Gryllus bimaculatus]|nr:Transmembrane protein 41-like protein [Gryllus bimaculatus]
MMGTQSTEGDVPVQCFEITSSFPTSRSSSSYIMHESPFPILIRQSEIRYRSGVNRNIYSIPRISSPQLLQNNVVENNCYEPKIHTPNHHGTSTRQAVATVITIFVVSLLALLYIYMKFPELQESEQQHLKIPWDIEDAKRLGQVLDRYKEKYYFEVLLAVFVTYIFLQTFAIPGSISLSILSGFLFPFPLALVLVNKHRSNLLNYLLFLRVTPFLPNWFINIVSPVIDVPLFPFWLGTFFGVAPPSFVAIQAGQTLYKLSASSDAWSWTSVILLAVFAILSLVPVLLKKQLRDKFE